jgi:cell division protein FtsB
MRDFVHFANGAQVAAAVVVIIAALASAVSYFRANYAKAQITALRGDRDDQAQRIERLDAENHRQSEQIKEMKVELVAERAARQALEKVVTGRDLLEELKTELTNHHDAAMRGQKSIFNTMGEVVDVLNQVKAAMPR